MLQPNTAKPGHSIWDGLNRRSFEAQIDALHRTNFVPESSILERKDWPKAREIDCFPFGTELQLSDDIAFISAYEYGVEHVTAVAVETQEQDGLLIRLAANEGVSKKVEDAWKQLIPLLEKCSAKVLSREKCEEDAFDVVVNLNKNRILGRMASQHFKPPSYHRGSTREALVKKLKLLVKPSRDCQSPDVVLLHRQVETFHAAFLRVEDSSADIGAIKYAIKCAFQLTVDGFSLVGRLKEAKVPASRVDRREVREINKLGNYWRICKDLVHLSRSYRSVFASVHLGLIEPFAPSTAYRGSKTKHVHAEIQMLVHYDIQGGSIWPRAIGVSKEACFLCSSLVKSHGLFFVSKAHRQVHPQWTVPDLSEYELESLDRLQKALLAVKKEVASVLRTARSNCTSRPLPLQSSTNLHRPNFPTPSVTTLQSLSTAKNEIETEIETVREVSTSPSADAFVDRRETESPGYYPQDQRCSTSQSLASCPRKALPAPSKTGGLAIHHNSLTRVQGPYNPAFATSDWLELFVSSAKRSSEDPTPESTLQAPVVSLTAFPERRCEESIDLSKLLPGQEMVVHDRADCNDEDGDLEVSVVLTFEQRTPILMRCIWAGSQGTRCIE